MKKTDYSGLIESYINDEMGVSEKQLFIIELSANKLLKREFVLWIKTDQILRNRGKVAFRKKLNTIMEAKKAKIHAFHLRRIIIFKYAATLTAAIIVGGLIYLSERPMPNSKLAEKYFRFYSPTATSRMGEIAGQSDYSIGLEYFNFHDFKNSAFYFNRIIESNPDDMHATLLKGISDFENRDYVAASIAFGIILENNKNIFTDNARWYLAMCYLLTDQKSKASEQMKIIKHSESIYRRAAGRVLRHLKW
ncbi:MAG: hypothetical protein WCE64_10905 [Bacteroidales bacterium]